MTAAALPLGGASGAGPAVHSGVRERWRMTVEARALVLVVAVILAFGLAVLYSASAIVAMQAQVSSAFYLQRQLMGVAAGAVIFAIAAKLDAERWKGWAWLIMGLALLAMLVVVLPGNKIGVFGPEKFQELQSQNAKSVKVEFEVSEHAVKSASDLRTALGV